MGEKIINVTHQKNIEKLLDKGLKRAQRIAYREILALLNVDGHEYCRSLIVCRNGEVYYSHKTTRKIMNELGMRYGLTYEAFVEKTKTSTTHATYKIPYVYKNIIALPDSGTARGSVNWFFLQHLVGYDSFKPTYSIHLLYEGVVFQTKIVKEGFYKQLEFVYTQYYKQIKEIKDWAFNEEIERSFIYQSAVSFHEQNIEVNEWSRFY